MSLGSYTPVYRLLVELLPVVASFRYPTKYFLVAMMAISSLAAAGWDALVEAKDGRRVAIPAGVGAVASGIAAAVALWTLAMPASSLGAFETLLRASGVADTAAGASYLLEVVPASGARLALVSGAAAALVWIGASSRREAPNARRILYGVVVADLLAAGWGLNPTLPAALFDEPQWVAATRAHPEDRVYVGGRASTVFPIDGIDADGPPGRIGVRVDLQMVAAKSVELAKVHTYPSAWHLRESVSTDLPALRDLAYYRVARRFVESDVDSRTRFLQRTGVRYFLMSRPPSGDAAPLAYLPTLLLTLYEGPAPTPRAAVVPQAAALPDIREQVKLLFDAGFDPATTVLLESEPPPPRGEAGSLPAGPSQATIVHDGPTEMTIRARVPTGGGYLVVYDSFDPHWRADVDGVSAPLLRANALFRAIPLKEGEHTIRLAYRPAPLYAGLTITALAALALVVLCFARRPHAASASRTIER
jgi:hypothetical protein